MATKANEIILELKAENKSLIAKLKESEIQINKLESSTKKSGGGIADAFKQIKQFVAAYLGVGLIKDLIGLAGEIDSVETSFYNLAKGAKGGAEGLLEAMTKAAQGTVDDTEIMKAANSAVMTLGEEVADKLPKIMEIALATSKATGKSTEDTFERLVMSVQSGSSRMLRQVGLSSAKVDIYVKQYAKSLGLTANQLTETEKKQAYLNAVLQTGEEAIKRTAGEGLTFGQKLQVLKSRMNDVADSAARALTPALDNLLTLWLKWTADSKGEGFFKLSTWAKGFGIFLNDVAYNIEVLKVKWDSFTNGLALTGDIIKQFFKTGDFTTFTKNIKTMWEYSNLVALEGVDKLNKKYTDLNTQIMEGGKRRTQQNTQNINKEIEDEEALRKRKEERMQADIKYYEYIGQLQEADLLQQKLMYDQLLELHGNVIQQKQNMETAYEKKKIIGAQQANNKMKQFDLDYLRAKLGFDSIEYQSAKEVFANSSSLMQSKNKFLFNMGKALSYASAIMSAAESIAKIWSVWGAYPPIAAAFTAISAAATGAQIATISSTKLPSYQKGKLPIFSNGYYPSDHFPAMIGAKEAVITEESARANSGIINAMFKNPGQPIEGNTVIVNQNNNITGNLLQDDFIINHIVPALETQARYAGKQLFAERK